MALPRFLKSYFWDVDFNTLEPGQYPYFVLDRILEYGDKKAIVWAVKYYPKNTLKKAVACSRALSPKSAYFWSVIFNIDKDKIVCLKKSSQKKQGKIWPY